MSTLNQFHPAVANWFQKAFEKPTEIQEKAWPAIKQRQNTLIAAPTGSGKTLAAFLSTIDDLVVQGLNGCLPEKTQVVYVSPLKALSNDIHRNLQIPLRGIEKELKRGSQSEIKIRVLVRTGDTSPSERTAMIKNPPHILVTTPESLYLLLTSRNGRAMLSDAHTVIVDEIHALVGSKRGSHLALSLERLEALTKSNLIRIGLSATQKPIETVAKFLIGNRAEKTGCHIIDIGHSRKLDLALELPKSPLTAVMPNEVWTEIHERLVELINEHQTTLIFVNTRRMAERLGHQLTEKLGENVIASHHGSMAKEQRLDAEQRLKSGKLKALVATASLELGIDIGSVDLVCQIGSPKSISAFLQRVGRSGHTVSGTPKGKLFPLSRDELVESVAILKAVKRGELDQIIVPEKPLDVLAQQIVAEVASQDYREDKLFKIFRRAYPYRDLSREEFDSILKMLAEGYTTRRGRRSAYIHHDIINGKLRARKGARLTALISGGTIPDNFDYDVIMEPTNTFIGTVNEDFAFESFPGDVFRLGNNSWRVLRVENGRIRVEDAGGIPPSIPFWIGEAPGRSAELSEAVSQLREQVADKLGDLKKILKGGESGGKELEDNNLDEKAGWKKPALDWLATELEINPAAADQLVTYLGTAKAALGVLPSQSTLVVERFFDEAGDMHLVVHSPFGSRLNRAWGLALRKSFCRKFNFELQAAATEDAIILSLGATHSFPLDEVFFYLNPKTVRHVLIQALLDSPMFEIRWRWNASRALAILRRRAGKKVPAQIQRTQAEDLIALIFPDQLACLENIAGDREIPDHPLVNQTIQDCLTEVMDIENLEKLLSSIHANKLKLITADLREPSPLSQEILNARPYAFLDDAPLEERRTNAVINRRWLDPSEAAELGNLDKEAIENVKKEAWVAVENSDELHDALVLCGFLTEKEGQNRNGSIDWKEYFQNLINEKRAAVLENGETRLWIAGERIPQLKAVFPKRKFEPEIQLPEKLRAQTFTKEEALVEILRGRLEALGPVEAKSIAESMGLPLMEIEQALVRLENEGFVFRGKFTPGTVETEWCERRLLARIHRYTLTKLRKEIEPVSSADFMRFLFSWHRILPDDQPEGPNALQEVLNQLEGFEAAAASWESDILPARIKDYDYLWLDILCLSGKALWGRFHKLNGNSNGKKAGTPIKTTPITLINRSNLSIWKSNTSSESDNLSHSAAKVVEFLSNHGASFYNEILEGTQLLNAQLEEAMCELVSGGMLTSDSFTGLRALLVPSKYRTKAGSRHRRNIIFNMEQAGRWSLIRNNSSEKDESRSGNQQKSSNGNIFSRPEIEQIARILLRRYGVIFRKLVDRENFAPPWWQVVRALRRLEARGEIRGGRFVDGVWGEQYALQEAVTKLRKIRNEKKEGTLLAISAADPLNLTGIITPEKRITSIYSNRILYKDGVPVAVKEGKEVKLLTEFEPPEKLILKNALIQRRISPKLRAYLGKGVL